jgi:hypothetical protein
VYVYVHHKKIAVFFPLDLVFNMRQGKEGVAKRGCEGSFKPIDVFHYVIGVPVMMHMKEPEILFLVPH